MASEFKLPETPEHNFYIVVFKQSGVGTPYYLQTREELDSKISACIELEYPFHVGHEFRMTLKS